MTIPTQPDQQPTDFSAIGTTIRAHHASEAACLQSQADYRVWLAQTGYAMLRQDAPDIDQMSNRDYLRTISDVVDAHDAREQRLAEIDAAESDPKRYNATIPKYIALSVVPPVIIGAIGYAMAETLGMDPIGNLIIGSMGSVLPSIGFAAWQLHKDKNKIDAANQHLIYERNGLQLVSDPYMPAIAALDALRHNQPDQFKDSVIRKQAETIVTTLANKSQAQPNTPASA